VHPGTPAAEQLTQRCEVNLTRDRSGSELVRMPKVPLRAVLEAVGDDCSARDPRVVSLVETEARYAGYLDRQQADIDKARVNDEMVLPDDIDWEAIQGLSNEVRQKFNDHRPSTVGQASRIPGVTPAAVSLLLVHVKKLGYRASA